MIVSPLMHQCTELLRHKTTLATHDPISVQLSRPDDPEYHYEAWDASHRSWLAKLEACQAAPAAGMAEVTTLHTLWLAWANKDIASNSGSALDDTAGTATVGRLTEPITERHRSEQANRPLAISRALQWGLRRVQETRASIPTLAPAALHRWAGHLWAYHAHTAAP
jgi:hypothetical protein